MGYSEDVYSSPEKHGLAIVAEISDDTLSYEFDMLVVWKDQAGQLFWASDSGCSCPSPFEDYGKVEDLTPLTAATFEDFRKAVAAMAVWGEREGVLAAQKADLLKFVANELDLWGVIA